MACESVAVSNQNESHSDALETHGGAPDVASTVRFAVTGGEIEKDLVADAQFSPLDTPDMITGDAVAAVLQHPLCEVFKQCTLQVITKRTFFLCMAAKTD